MKTSHSWTVEPIEQPPTVNIMHLKLSFTEAERLLLVQLLRGGRDSVADFHVYNLANTILKELGVTP